MTDTKMSFKEALTALLNGENVESKFKDNDWTSFKDDFGHIKIISTVEDDHDKGYQFRIKPRTVMCNGVEVPAPLSEYPEIGSEMWFPDFSSDSLVACAKYDGTCVYSDMLELNVLYSSKEDAIARAKAMLITK